MTYWLFRINGKKLSMTLLIILNIDQTFTQSNLYVYMYIRIYMTKPPLHFVLVRLFAFVVVVVVVSDF